MSDGVLPSFLEQTWCKLFFGMQALPKIGGHVLTPDFGTMQNAVRMGSNEERLKTIQRSDSPARRSIWAR